MDIDLTREEAFSIYNRVRVSFPARDEIPGCNVEGRPMYLDNGSWCRDVKGGQRRIVIGPGRVTVDDLKSGRWVKNHAYADPGVSMSNAGMN